MEIKDVPAKEVEPVTKSEQASQTQDKRSPREDNVKDQIAMLDDILINNVIMEKV